MKTKIISITREINQGDVIVNIGKMSWPLLRKQKQKLLKLMDYLEVNTQNPSKNAKKFFRDSYETLEGILNLIDRIQDDAVDAFGLPEEKVFGKPNDT